MSTKEVRDELRRLHEEYASTKRALVDARCAGGDTYELKIAASAAEMQMHVTTLDSLILLLDALDAAEAERDRLRAAAHDAFMSMCAQRDCPDAEVFQDAIDALGLASNGDTP